MAKLFKKKYEQGGPAPKKKVAPKKQEGYIDAGISADILNEYLVKGKSLGDKGMKKIADYESKEQAKFKAGKKKMGGKVTKAVTKVVTKKKK